MLQLPASSAPVAKFTRAEIADISRGAIVKTVKPRARPDYIVGRLPMFEAAVRQHIANEQTLNSAKAELEPHHAVSPTIWPIAVEPAIGVFSGPFYTEKHIWRVVREHRKRLTALRKQERRTNTGCRQIKLERDQRIASYTKTLKNLPTIEAALLRAMRTETRRVQKLQRGVNFSAKEQAWYRGYSEMWSAFHALHWQKVRSTKGALAILDLIRIVKNGHMEAVSIIPMVAHAQAILAAHYNQGSGVSVPH